MSKKRKNIWREEATQEETLGMLVLRSGERMMIERADDGFYYCGERKFRKNHPSIDCIEAEPAPEEPELELPFADIEPEVSEIGD